jgi:hypothetical protein
VYHSTSGRRSGVGFRIRAAGPIRCKRMRVRFLPRLALGLAAMVIALASLLPAQCAPAAWTAMNQFPGLSGTAYAATSWDPDGAGPLPPVLAVGGAFEYADTFPPHHVQALAVYNGQLVAGTSNAPCFVAWTGTTWQALGGGATPQSVCCPTVSGCRALAVFNGELVAGGSSTTAGGAPVSAIARWNGTVWQPMGTGFTSVTALGVYGGQLATSTDATFGPFYAPVGLTFDLATVDVTGGAICPSATTRYTVY